MEKSVFLNGWLYNAPNMSQKCEGDRVLISMGNFGPLETYEWGIDGDGKPYEMYKWLENDLYECTNYRETITAEKLAENVTNTKEMFAKAGLADWASAYEKVLERFCGQPEK